MIITIKKIEDWGKSCLEPGNRYSYSRLNQLLRGRKGLTPLEVSWMQSVPYPDRLWVLLRHEILKRHFLDVVVMIAERSVRRYALRCGYPLIEEWAVKWLNYCDFDKYEIAKLHAELVKVNFNEFHHINHTVSAAYLTTALIEEDDLLEKANHAYDVSQAVARAAGAYETIGLHYSYFDDEIERKIAIARRKEFRWQLSLIRKTLRK